MNLVALKRSWLPAAIGALAFAACAAPAIAGEIATTAAGGTIGATGLHGSAPAEIDTRSAPRAVISVSRAADALGKPVYAARTSLAGTGSLVVFSTSRPRVFSTPSTTSALSAPSMIMAPTGNALPVAARALTSGFGMRGHPLLGRQRAHLGIDLAAPTGSPIVATSDGVVTTADWRGGYGLFVALDHGRGLETRYGHMSRLGVGVGQRVSRGQILGFVGSTGLSTGPHLHYEMRVNGQPIDPLPSFLRKR
ncbi:M23 family metallopeptidase [Novosphingobium sp. JCM 18896]|uniref:M23 family metallopeptidase n=1 Tax=Novosphingobium sp. JCM 18896 TaxID=2989731 RepID=UPI0022239D58|nr:M23 family metallopeptidase [Novosphingobium sp. JCM 18896]MCW1430683.1 M23 family metallopeptidase [Novosphingobium sp. JCM 18896]